MIEEEAIAEPTLLPDIGVWHPLAPQVFAAITFTRGVASAWHSPAPPPEAS